MIAGRYSLDREIGRGGMGAVWLARDEVLGREVALKRLGLSPGAAGSDVARAEREARLSARLHHPHVVAVFDFVVEADTQWLVMEYVEGTNLAHLVRDRGELTADHAASLLWQVADALVAAHAEGIVHRDVKPSNVLVDRDGIVKLSDFGIARVAADPSLTQTGVILGSPTYLAPEVASGGRGDAASDVWSLGATAYHLLSGRPPYQIGDNVLHTLFRIVNEEPPQLTDAGWLAPLVENTLVKDPARRWSAEHARDFLASRDPLTETRPMEPLPARSLPVRRRTVSPMPVLVGGVILVLALAAGLYGAFGRGDSGPDGTAIPPAAASSPSVTPSPTPSPRPTAQGMESFIRDYVRTVSADPHAAWRMLTPKFQRASGGFARYRAFWSPARNGRVLDIAADPHDLRVSYQVHFDHFHNGPGPTVLDLVFDHGRYRIDAEHTRGFEPAD